jgi:alkylated DNA repair dioxygenase AlkB
VQVAKTIGRTLRGRRRHQSGVPSGFRYEPEVVSQSEEGSLIEHLAQLQFREFEFQGYLGRRRVISFGWTYDFNRKELQRAAPLPPFLVAIREQAARFADVVSGRLEQALVTEYPAGAAIGWHKDKAIFGDVVGISLATPCLLRFRRKEGTSWDRASISLEPRSAYLLTGPSRADWQHSIPPVDGLRYSITFRTLKSHS